MFVIRGKLGDSLLAFMVLLEYAAAFPDDEITLMVRKAYVPLFLADTPGKVVAFGSRVEMMLKVLWLRARRIHFDVLGILWGFGPPIAWIGRWVSATRKIYLNPKLPSIYPEWPKDQTVNSLVDPAWKVARLIEPTVRKPDRLRLKALSELHSTLCTDAIGIVPVADEPRKCLDAESLLILLDAVRVGKGKRPIWVLLNRGDEGAGPLLDMKYPRGCTPKYFSNMKELIDLQAGLSEWMGVDTGLYHLAVSMGVPATLFFGPTQPGKNVLPGQGTKSYRIAELRNEHCEVKTCVSPFCLYRVMELYGNRPFAPLSEGSVPEGCLLTSCNALDTSHLACWTGESGTSISRRVDQEG